MALLSPELEKSMVGKRKGDGENLQDFEKAQKRLTSITEVLEDENTTLEQSLQAFEEGIALVRSAQSALTEAEQRVQVLLEENGNPAAHNLEADGSQE
jgi:exodeoxyribonuclease VII small subunit